MQRPESVSYTHLIMARNQLIEMATASLSDLMKEYPEHRAEAKQDLQLLNAQKMGEHEAEIEKIKNVFLAILRDIKKDIDNGEQPGEAVTAAMFQAMRDALAEQKQKPLSIDDVKMCIRDRQPADCIHKPEGRLVQRSAMFPAGTAERLPALQFPLPIKFPSLFYGF